VADAAAGRVDMAAVETEDLPKDLQAVPPAGRKGYVAQKAAQRQVLRDKIVEPAKQRQAFIEAKVREAGREGKKSGCPALPLHQDPGRGEEDTVYGWTCLSAAT